MVIGLLNFNLLGEKTRGKWRLSRKKRDVTCFLAKIDDFFCEIQKIGLPLQDKVKNSCVNPILMK